MTTTTNMNEFETAAQINNKLWDMADDIQYNGFDGYHELVEMEKTVKTFTGDYKDTLLAAIDQLKYIIENEQYGDNYDFDGEGDFDAYFEDCSGSAWNVAWDLLEDKLSNWFSDWN